MYVVFDSNVWLSELGLASARASAARFFVKKKGAEVVVPEVIRLETEEHLRDALNQYVSEIDGNYRRLLTIFGKLKEIVLPSETDINQRVSQIIEDSKLNIVQVPFSLESARSSFLKIIHKTPPSDKDQQFKDGVMWGDCMTLLEKGDVHLVTSDKAFFQDRQYERGLSDPLAREANAYPNKLRLFPTLSEFLKDIATEVELDNTVLADSFLQANRTAVDGLLSRNGFALTGDPLVKTNVFVTEDPDKLYIEFSIVYQCDDAISAGRADARLLVSGDCSYKASEHVFSDFRAGGEELAFTAADGEQKSVHNYYLRVGSAVLGHRTVEHTVRYKLRND